MSSSKIGKFQFAIDRGGTFTDIHAICPGGKTRVMKLLSVDPQNYSDAPREGIKRILEQELQCAVSEPINASLIEFIRMGTTVGTNALLERKGERMALAITEGLRDLLHIGNQSRPKIFDLKIEIPDVLYEDIVEVRERAMLHQGNCKLKLNGNLVTGTTTEKLHVWKPLDEERLRKDLKRILDKGIYSLAVVLMHAYTFTKHEERVGEIAFEMGFKHVSLSSQVMPMVKIVPRGYTTCVDAYLTPCIKDYVSSFRTGFTGGDLDALFMQSDGGLTRMEKFCGSRAILSGPAGGVVGYAMTSFKDKPVVGFDMGGTSTDVSRYNGEYEHVFETAIGGVTLQSPQLDINTVAAGGGSKLFFRSGMFVVGPESAGAHPGPACYRKSGPLTVTDANLCLGRLLPEYFPKIFGSTENLPLDAEATQNAFERLTGEINDFLGSSNREHVPLTTEEVALGFIDVANESMCRPIRSLTQAKGHDTSRHVLSCFGGAGGQHACSIARLLGMGEVFIHKYSGILSAYGMALANVVHEAQKPLACVFGKGDIKMVDKVIDELVHECEGELTKQGFPPEKIKTDIYLNLRYDRTDCAIMCLPVTDTKGKAISKYGDFLTTFHQRHKIEFGFLISQRDIIVDDVRVRGTGLSGVKDDVILKPSGKPAKLEKVVRCYFEGGHQNTKVYLLENLFCDHVINGPAIIIDKNSTIVVEPNCKATITEKGDVVITIGSGIVKKVGKELDSIQLSIFSHRFMSIAEQMGKILQRTSISVNIKERLDFSCALFGPDGGLVSNAPHIPVHLGAMQQAVQYQMKSIEINEGDCILSNHPCAGGVHLPDFTVITPVFIPSEKKPIFYLANRGHHADIGGTTPGSMPSNSTSIQHEGAVFVSFKLVKNGVFQEEEVTAELMAPGKLPGCSGARNLHDNLADLRAQVAANQRGIHLVNELVQAYGLDVVQAYMGHIQENAELAVRNLLRDVASRTGSDTLLGEDNLDDGSSIKLKIIIDPQVGSALFDFEGTSPMLVSNLNTPRAITFSAIIYCLRCLVGYDVPLNQGCLAPIQVKIPKWCLLDPDKNAAVVGGNVLTSQRLVDVILKAFNACAASQGCMNNTTFGDDSFGYYETVAGGAGAGPTWHGRSGVHSHMTNTRITDPELLERRYPIILRQFRLNSGTGGRGKFNGGDGVIREMIFRKNLTLSVLCERRVFAPYGLNGGNPGKKGINLLLRNDGAVLSLGGKNLCEVHPWDVFQLNTPGGGGYGTPSSDCDVPPQKRHKVGS